MPAATQREHGSSLSHFSFLRWQGMQTKTRLLRFWARTRLSGAGLLGSTMEKVEKYPAGISDESTDASIVGIRAVEIRNLVSRMKSTAVV